MKTVSKKGALLIAAALAVCALAPSMTSAASWGVVGSEHTLDVPIADFTIPAAALDFVCNESQFTVNVTAQALVITDATFRRCTASGLTFGSCTLTMVATGLPWTVTAVTSTTIQIHGIRIDATTETHPGSSGCTAPGVRTTLTGTLTNGHWTGNGGGEHEILFENAAGLTQHSSLAGSLPVRSTSTIRDTQQTLTVTG